MASKYEQFFREADTDKSGLLTLDELVSILRKKGYKDADTKIRGMFRSIDTSGDDKISLDEYLKAMGEIADTDHKAAAMRQCFREFDANGDGTIDRGELDKVFQSMGKHFSPQELDRMIAQCDKDGSGSINYEEFITKVFGQ
jgi:Ca2+-binding EF-hand superfamily protein